MISSIAPVRLKLFAILIATAIFDLTVSATVIAQDSLTEAEVLYKKALTAGSLSDKISLLEAAVDKEPGYAVARYQLGVAYFQERQYDPAIIHLVRAEALDPGLKPETTPYLRNSYTFLAEARIQAERFEDALTSSGYALALDDSYAPAYAARGKACFGLEEWAAAIDALERSVSLNENQAATWNKLGDAYLRIEAYPEAVHAYEKALKLDPELKEAQFHLNVANMRNTPEEWLLRCENARRNGDPEKALRLLEAAHSAHPDNEEIREKLAEQKWQQSYEKGKAAFADGNMERALALFSGIDAGYRDTAFLLARIEDMMAEKNSPAPRKPAADSDKTRSAVTLPPRNSETATKQPIPSEVSAPPGTDAFPSLKTETLATDSQPFDSIGDHVSSQIESTLVSSASASDSLVAAASRDSVLKEDQPASLGAYWYWGGGIATLSLLAAVFFFSKSARKNRLVLKRARAGITDATAEIPVESSLDEILNDADASVTPVDFDAPARVPNGVKETQTLGDQLFLRDTQTILGGIKKVRRIGRYIIEKEIGRGSMGLIYKAWDPKLDRSVVIKQMAFDFSNNKREVAKLKDRLFREARAAGRLNHENIVIIYDVDEEDDFSYIVMEYLDGNDLKSLLEPGTPFGLDHTIRIVSQICRALEFAHKNGIVHRDVKPSNIICSTDGKVKVADFGIAKLAHLGTLTQTGGIVGTPFYMSPEQVEGRKLDGRSDIFSVGVILYEMLTGVHPFDGENISTVVYKIVHKAPKLPSMVNGDLPGDIDTIVERACSKDQKFRYANAGELMSDLEKLKGD